LAKAYAKKPGVVLDHIISKDYWYRYAEPTPSQKAAANREIQKVWLEGFCEGLKAKFKEQVQQSESLALVLVIHPVVQDAYRDLNLGKSRYRATSNGVENGAARRAGFEAGKAFSPQRPARIGAPTPCLPAAR
jgi:hypothetical protein